MCTIPASALGLMRLRVVAIKVVFEKHHVVIDSYELLGGSEIISSDQMGRHLVI